MPLTRDEWYEMFATIKLIEAYNEELRLMSFTFGPSRRQKIQELVHNNQCSIIKMKSQIQGQIEEI